MAKADEAVPTTPTRDYDIYGQVDLDGEGAIVSKFLVTWNARNHADALRGWGSDYPDVAAQYPDGFLIVTKSASKIKSGTQRTTFVVTD